MSTISNDFTTFLNEGSGRGSGTANSFRSSSLIRGHQETQGSLLTRRSAGLLDAYALDLLNVESGRSMLNTISPKGPSGGRCGGENGQVNGDRDGGANDVEGHRHATTHPHSGMGFISMPSSVPGTPMSRGSMASLVGRDGSDSFSSLLAMNTAAVGHDEIVTDGATRGVSQLEQHPSRDTINDSSEMLNAKAPSMKGKEKKVSN